MKIEAGSHIEKLDNGLSRIRPAGPESYHVFGTANDGKRVTATYLPAEGGHPAELRSTLNGNAIVGNEQVHGKYARDAKPVSRRRC
jgi:hypothetical protein